MGNIILDAKFASGVIMLTVSDFDCIVESFQAFHGKFADLFGRREARERSKEYLCGLLVQTGERKNAENLSEVVTASARVLQRFLTEAPWDDMAVVERMQEYLGPRLNHWEAVWAIDDSGMPKQGKKSAGVARQYCGQVGKVANCQVGVFLAHVGPRGRALADYRLFLPEAWADDAQRCEAAGIPAEARTYTSKTDMGLEMLRVAKSRGHLQARWVTGDDAYGMSPAFRDGVAAEGFLFVLEVPGNTPVWPLDVEWVKLPNPPIGRPTIPKPAEDKRLEVRERAAALPAETWTAITVAEGAQGLRTYLFAFEHIRETRDRKPGQGYWLIHRKNLDHSEPRFFFSNAPDGVPQQELARVAAARWPIETEFEVNKTLVGLNEYEVRSWRGWHHHIAMCLLASAFLLTLQQEWGKKDAPDHSASSISNRLRILASHAF
jgi:SRSO17 transposase